jgi:hypothetical protein
MNPAIRKPWFSGLSSYLLVIVILWSIPTASMAAGPLTLSSHALRVGTVREGVTIKKSVTLENTGDKEIVIKNISTS